MTSPLLPPAVLAKAPDLLARIGSAPAPSSVRGLEVWGESNGLLRAHVRLLLGRLVSEERVVRQGEGDAARFVLPKAAKTTETKTKKEDPMAQKQKPSADWKEKLAAYVTAHPGVTLASIGRWAGGAKLNPDEVRAEAQRLGVSGELVRPASARKTVSKYQVKKPAAENKADGEKRVPASKYPAKKTGPAASVPAAKIDVDAVALAAKALAPLSDEGRRLAVALAVVFGRAA